MNMLPVSFHFPKQTQKCTSILIFMLKRQITPKIQKFLNVNFPSRDLWHSLKNICYCFLRFLCRRMPWECNYYFHIIHSTTLKSKIIYYAFNSLNTLIVSLNLNNLKEPCTVIFINTNYFEYEYKNRHFCLRHFEIGLKSE